MTTMSEDRTMLGTTGFWVGQEVRDTRDHTTLTLGTACLCGCGFVRNADGILVDPQHLEAIQAAPRPFQVGDRVRVSDPAYTQASGTGHVNERFFGAEATIMRLNTGGMAYHSVALADGMDNVIHPNYLTLITAEAARVAGVFAVGDRCRIVGDRTQVGTSSLSDGDLVVITTTTEGIYEQDVIGVRRESDGQVSRVWRRGLVLTDGSTPAPAPARLETVDPLPIGQRVLAGKYVGKVVPKDTVPSYNMTEEWRTSADRVAVVTNDNEPTCYRMGQVTVLEDVSVGGRTAEQRLLRLQTLIHRVASFEAVQRDWCNEANSALAMMYAEDPETPEYLTTIDRSLGRELVDNPRSIYRFDETAPLPAEAPPETEEREYQAQLSVDYAASAGFSVTGATVYVTFTAEVNPDDGFEGDASDYITDEMVDSAIDYDSDLPDSEGSYGVSWSVDDVQEA